MELEEEFAIIIKEELLPLKQNIIYPYIMSCYKSLSDFVSEKTHIYIRFNHHHTEQIVRGFYKIGIENCQKEYNYYNSILIFREQFDVDYQLMMQIRLKYYSYSFNEYVKHKNQTLLLMSESSDKYYLTKKDIKFYIDKYKFYSSFQINLS